MAQQLANVAHDTEGWVGGTGEVEPSRLFALHCVMKRADRSVCWLSAVLPLFEAEDSTLDC
jgi:hypothetical protein